MTSTTINCPNGSLTRSFGLDIPLRVVALYFKRRTARRELNELTPAQLRDVGLGPDVLSREHKLPVDPRLTIRLQSLM